MSSVCRPPTGTPFSRPSTARMAGRPPMSSTFSATCRRKRRARRSSETPGAAPRRSAAFVPCTLRSTRARQASTRRAATRTTSRIWRRGSTLPKDLRFRRRSSFPRKAPFRATRRSFSPLSPAREETRLRRKTRCQLPSGRLRSDADSCSCRPCLPTAPPWPIRASSCSSNGGSTGSPPPSPSCETCPFRGPSLRGATCSPWIGSSGVALRGRPKSARVSSRATSSCSPR